MQEWTRLIQEIKALLERLMALEEEKRQVVVSGDVERLQAITREETGLSAQLGNLETQRQRQVVVYCLRAGMEPGGVTLATLLPTLPEGPEREALAQAREELLERAHALEQAIELNRQLLTTQAEITQFMLEGVSHQMTAGMQYSGTGRDADMHDQIRILNRDA